MIDKINIADIYDKDINFLIGAGASTGLFPNLSTNMKIDEDNWESIETLAEHFDQTNKTALKTLLFMYYYKECIEPVMICDYKSIQTSSNIDPEDKRQSVIDNYKSLLTTMSSILDKRKGYDKKLSVFTTNYDSCFVEAYDQIIKETKLDFNINDGSKGFKSRYVEARNFNSIQVQSGIFDKVHTAISQIDIVHLHGSAYWRKEDERIEVIYHNNNMDRKIDSIAQDKLTAFKQVITNEESNRNSFLNIEFTPAEKDAFDATSSAFWDEYNKLPIVNPTKWKFHETVFEEHYYQMLRHLSYELEKPNSVLIAFGFSFADEHIRNLVKRSLNNKKLIMYVSCFSEGQYNKMHEYFGNFNNVKLVKVDGRLDFTKFNTDVFTLAE
ncbi:hypothetical protein AKG98_3915 [Moritella sp. JT01]|uniref:SIR2 family protein n=1 Tax=Moritella sp. JT01 TaxID=756698 RepID=UPI000794BC08|nr:SIR2 family protein [Moritella sp. JT01]KXO12720.1 hypothetical protein AKG98_3915 [Moritella sp. JT01]